MPRMPRILAALAFACLAGSAAHADPRVTLGWDTCAGPIDKTILPGWVASLYLSVLGQAEGHQGYDLRIRITTWCGTDGPISALPDAWRFEAGGCQGSDLVSVDHLLVVGPLTCPAFQGPLQSQQVKEYAFDPTTESARVTLINVYPTGNPNPYPATRYFLGRVLFDQSYGVNGPTDPGLSCGRLEVPVCFLLTKASWLDLASDEHEWARDQECITANDPSGATACSAGTPARATTWGAIKQQYR